MKSRIKIVIALAVLLVASLKIRNALYAQDTQRDTSASPDAGSKPAADQTGIRVVLPKGKKLILKDGTFQLAREYSVEGDRVRYWSVERSDWEEIPAQMVDWDATHKDEAEQTSHDAELKTKIHASEVAERTKNIDVDRSLEIKPGVFLPDAIGFYAVENNKLIHEMKQGHADSKMATGREVARIMTGVPIIPHKETLEIPGAPAPMRLTTAEPEFFMRPADDREPRFRLIRAQLKGGRRILDSVDTFVSGEKSHSAVEVAIQTWTPAHGVFRYTVEQRLEPGEYAFIEMTSEGINAYVWDFGVDLPGTKSSK